MSLNSRWILWTLVSFCAALLYAVLRYHVFGTVAWRHLPLFTVNKAVSFCSLMLLAAAYMVRRPGAGLSLGLAGAALAWLHAIMSLAILAPSDFPKLYAGGRLHVLGGLAVLCGSVGMLLLLVPAAASIPGIGSGLSRQRWQFCQRCGYAVLFLTGIHVLAIGVKGWADTAAWPVMMPPITMLSFAISIAPLILRIRRKARAGGEHP
jgi:DMSO/TMAO reductase YedYZ heme-binding membrane subunit